MKKTLVSLAAASLIVTSAMAADKGIDIVTTGQTVLYYESNTNGNPGQDIFSAENSQANVGVQLNLGADLGNNFTFGSQISWLGTMGLEKNLVNGVKQVGGNNPINPNTSDELALSKIFIAKQIANTTVKIGRQELPKSLSPFAFSEGWNVFKNTFDAILVVNTDVPDTTIVGAWVGTSNSTVGTGLGVMTDLRVGSPAGSQPKGAYMLTVANKSIPMTTLTGSVYELPSLASAYWLDAKIAGKDLPLGLSAGLQAGSIAPKASGVDSTTAFGLKVGMKPMSALYLQLAYSSVDDGAVGMKNTGTGIKTPLYTQMVYNQNAIAKDNSTFVAKGVYNTGDFGKIIAQFGMTADNSTGPQVLNPNGSVASGPNDYSELDLIYKIKSGGVQYFAAIIMVQTDSPSRDIIGTNPGAAGTDSDNKLRVWARYAF